MYTSIIIALALGLLALIFVLYPLFRTRSSERSLPRPPSGEETPGKEREQAARNALQEVELDFQLGNIAETDYRALRERYMRHALVSLKSRYEHEEALDNEIEEQLRKMREQKSDAAQ